MIDIKIDLAVAKFVAACLNEGYASHTVAAALVRGAAHIFHAAIGPDANVAHFLKGAEIAFMATRPKPKPARDLSHLLIKEDPPARVEPPSQTSDVECEQCGGEKMIVTRRSIPGGFDENIYDDCPSCVKKDPPPLQPEPPPQKFDIDGPGGLPLDAEGYPTPCAICGRAMCDHLPGERPDSWDNTVGKRSS